MLRLHAGPLEMVFDCTNAFLRHIKCGGREVLRGIFGAVRDANWGTVEPEVRLVRKQVSADGFQVSFLAECRNSQVHFIWKGEVHGDATGTISYRFDGEARRAFLRNRIGLCVLHPIVECAGQKCEVKSVDGTVLSGTFPLHISPDQPFKNIRSIAHTIFPGLKATVVMEGDVFEMEDQRNWTDASFKTYSTPLELPFPVTVKEGERIQQTVIFRLTGKPPRPQTIQPAQTRLRVNWNEPRRLPSLGFILPSGTLEVAPTLLEALTQLRPAHLRCDLDVRSGNCKERLRMATQIANDIRSVLHLVIHLGPEPARELDEIISATTRLDSPIGLWVILSRDRKVSDPAMVTLTRAKLSEVDSSAPIAAGTDAYFAELNRNRPPTGLPAMPSFTINPQVHAFDNLSLVETISAQRDTIFTARQFSPQPVALTAITLRARFNPNATRSDLTSKPESDPRQGTRFAAAWTLGTIARLGTCENVHSLTFYEIVGKRGMTDPEGRLFPVGHLFAALNNRGLACECRCTDPLIADALGLIDEAGNRRLLIAGFGKEAQMIVLENIDSETVLVEELHGDGFTHSVPRSTHNGTLELSIAPESVTILSLQPLTAAASLSPLASVR